MSREHPIILDLSSNDENSSDEDEKEDDVMQGVMDCQPLEASTDTSHRDREPLQVSRNSFVQHDFRRNLETETRIQLQQKLKKCGISGHSISKSKMVDLLSNNFNQALMANHKKIMSFDVGYKNMAFVLMDLNYKVLHWGTFDLGLTSSQPQHVATHVRAFLDTLHASIDLPGQCPHPQLIYMIEEQGHRYGLDSSITESIFRVNMVAAVLNSILFPSAINISPKKVFCHHSLPDCKSQILSYKKKKQWAVGFAQQIIEEGERITFSNVDIKKEFDDHKKKDDLSDALLIAIAFIDWHKEKITHATKMIKQNQDDIELKTSQNENE